MITALLAVAGLGGLPQDVQGWGSLFSALGGEAGRWVLVCVAVGGFLLLEGVPRLRARSRRVEVLARVEQVYVELGASQGYLAQGVDASLPQDQWNQHSEALRKEPAFRPALHAVDAAHAQVNLFNHGKAASESVTHHLGRARQAISDLFPQVDNGDAP